MSDKMFIYSGANTMRILMDQERKHWLMKTDKSKTLQDKETGDMFKSVIDNNGGEIILSTEKLTDSNDFIQTLAFDTHASSGSDILEFQTSAFTYSPSVNGLTFARIKASKYPYSYGGSVQYFNYKIKFTDCEIITLLFGTSKNSSNVIPTKWIKTTSTPIVVVINTADDNVIIEKELEFVSDITNPVWYYPLTENLQPFGLTETGNNEYTTSLVINDNNIGFPMYWFTCDNSNIGPNVSITDSGNVNNNGDVIIYFGAQGSSSKYDVLGYVGIDGNNDSTPSCDTTLNFSILVHPKGNNVTFSGDIDTDKNIDLSRIIVFKDTTNQTEYSIPITLSSDTGSMITMNTDDVVWEYVDSRTYSIPMSTFDGNCVNVASTINTLIPFIKIHLDESIPFEVDDTDYGTAGIYMSSMNPHDDIHEGYPFDISNFDGLPTWMTTDTPDRQRLAMYAIHNTPFYSEADPRSRQVSGLLFDLGQNVADSDEQLSNDQFGRIYYVGNDVAEYENNATSEHPKPPRTVARICDIPTTVVQLSNISGLAPASIVDKKYVRTEASYTEEEKDRVWNILSSRWVRPSNVDADNNPIYESDQTLVFESEDDLNRVDLISHNDFRYRLNLNPMVDVNDVYISSIVDGGSGYQVEDNILLVIGGFSFTITPLTVDEDGAVLTAGIGSNEPDVTRINLSNFNLNSSGTGTTEVYATSPRSGNGSGFKCVLGIRNFSNYTTKKGGIFEDLFAVVHLEDGIYFYQYIINNPDRSSLLTGVWTKGTKISSIVNSTSTTSEGNLSTEDAFTIGNVPHYRSFQVQQVQNNQQTLIMYGMKTNNFINIPSSYIHSPFDIDISKYYSNGETLQATAINRTPYGVSKALHNISKLYYDSYIIWRWKTNSASDLNFEYAIIRRSLNNYISTDVTNYLPHNDIYVNSYLHTNNSTTIVWNTNDDKTFIFVFDPTYTKHESYSFVNDGFEIVTSEFTFDDIDMKTSPDQSYQTPVLFDINGPLGKLQWNIMTTCPIHVENVGSTPVDNGVATYDDWQIGTQRQIITHYPIGGWRCVMPKQTKFRFINGATSVIPIQLDIVRRSASQSQQTVRFVKDSNDNDVSNSTLIIDTNTTTNTTHLKAFNPQTNQFEEL